MGKSGSRGGIGSRRARGRCPHPSTMLEQLFGSKTRVRLLRLFLNNDKGAYFVRQLTRKIGAQINAIRNELDNLVDMGLVVIADDVDDSDDVKGRGRSIQQRKYYRLHTESLLVPELRALFIKSQVHLEKDFVRKVTSAGSVSYMALTGFFVGEDDAPTDVFLVGKINRDKAIAIIKSFEREVGREVNYTIMTPQEYKYRREVTDRFLYSILESRKLVVVDSITERVGVAA